ncbi:hypothetical protein AB7C87_15290 [Natrarchaeobius sp. A-rgal3]|uniref:hypothetical protein n=1 Tax=Natrarchaeobius versutus TaxID=1679078 RepID=UPI003510565C
MVFQLVEELLFGTLLDRTDRSGPRWAGLFLGVLCLLFSAVVGLWIGPHYGIALAVVGFTLTVFCV